MSKPIKIGINGFGRIGRNFFKASFDNQNIEVVAINDLTDSKTLAHLLQYDSVFRKWSKEVSFSQNKIIASNQQIAVLSEPNIEKIPWQEYNVDIVIESTGIFTDATIAKSHITNGKAKKVIISAPAKNEDITIVLPINSNRYNSKEHHVISNASCTTNCLSPIAKVVLDNFGIEKGFMNTIHSYTNDQKILDLPHKDLRRARASACSMIPTTTGAAKAVSLVLPELEGKINGSAVRVPTPDVSIVDFVVTTSKNTTKEEVNQCLQNASNTYLKGIMEYNEIPLVSSDYIGNPHSCIIDGLSTDVIQNNLVRILGWYDNEWGYANRIADLAVFVIT